MRTVGDLIYKALERFSLADGRFLVVVLPLSNEEAFPEFDRPWKSDFLKWLSHGLTIQQAADLSGVSRKHAYHSRSVDASFREAWNRIRKTSDRKVEEKFGQIGSIVSKRG